MLNLFKHLYNRALGAFRAIWRRIKAKTRQAKRALSTTAQITTPQRFAVPCFAVPHSATPRFATNTIAQTAATATSEILSEKLENLYDNSCGFYKATAQNSQTSASNGATSVASAIANPTATNEISFVGADTANATATPTAQNQQTAQIPPSQTTQAVFQAQQSTEQTGATARLQPARLQDYCRYSTQLRAHTLKPATIATREHLHTMLFRALGDIDIASFSPLVACEFVRSQLARGLRPSTIQRLLAYAREGINLAASMPILPTFATTAPAPDNASNTAPNVVAAASVATTQTAATVPSAMTATNEISFVGADTASATATPTAQNQQAAQTPQTVPSATTTTSEILSEKLENLYDNSCGFDKTTAQNSQTSASNSAQIAATASNQNHQTSASNGAQIAASATNIMTTTTATNENSFGGATASQNTATQQIAATAPSAINSIYSAINNTTAQTPPSQTTQAIAQNSQTSASNSAVTATNEISFVGADMTTAQQSPQSQATKATAQNQQIAPTATATQIAATAATPPSQTTQAIAQNSQTGASNSAATAQIPQSQATQATAATAPSAINRIYNTINNETPQSQATPQSQTTQATQATPPSQEIPPSQVTKAHIDRALSAISTARRLLRVPPRTIRTISAHSIRTLLEHARGELRTFLYVAFYTGARASEILGLGASDIDYRARTITITHNHTRYGTTTPKCGYARTIPLPRPLARHLREVGFCGFGMGYFAMNYRFGKLRRKLALPPMTIHHARHTYASMCLHLRIAPPLVARYLGHTDTTMLTRVYSHAILSRRSEQRLENMSF